MAGWSCGKRCVDFIDLSDGPFLLKSFVKTDFRDGGTFIEAVADFDDSEFSECEIEMMDEVLAKYGNMTASELVSETHKGGHIVVSDGCTLPDCWKLLTSMNATIPTSR